MIDTSILKYIMIGAGVLFAIIIIAYIILNKKMGKSEYKQIKKLREGTKADTFSMEILYQKLYLTYIRTPFIKRYIYKLRRRFIMRSKTKSMQPLKRRQQILTLPIIFRY